MVKPRVLIVGVDSIIGASLKVRLEGSGIEVLGTTRRRETIDEKRVFLDMASEVNSWRCPEKIDAAILCACIAKGNAIERDPAYSYRVNVEAVSTLVRRLMARNIFVVFLSSSAVFDGKASPSRPDTPPSPLSDYGGHKVIVESLVLKEPGLGSVVRLSKYLNEDFLC